MKVKCVKIKKDETNFTLGKIYEWENNSLIDDNGYAYGERMVQGANPREWRLSSYYDFEIVEEAKNDPVNHPSHYTDGKIEVIDFILDKRLNFTRGNAVKYISRAGKKNKDKEIEDLQKAVWYINKEIERLKKEQKI